MVSKPAGELQSFVFPWWLENRVLDGPWSYQGVCYKVSEVTTVSIIFWGGAFAGGLAIRALVYGVHIWLGLFEPRKLLYRELVQGYYGV